MNKIEFIEYEVYEEIINVPLFNKIISFISESTNIKDKKTILSIIEKNCIWFNYVEGTYIQEEYGFEYLGELLERFEERIGNDIEDIRAISLALSYSKRLIEDNMITGTQLVDFQNKIKKIAENDIYLQGSLYMYDNEKYNYFANELLRRKYCNTEDIIFVLSVFIEDIENILNYKSEEIINLLGKEKTISTIGNIKLYVWLIRILYPLVKKNRKKDMALLKALIKLPIGFQKENTIVYNELIKNNYSVEEIAYLNYAVLYYDTVPDAIKLGYSIVEEKIVIQLCKLFINSKETHSENIYSLIENLIEKYKRFNIKCYGFSGIKQALENETNIVNPQTFIKLYQILDDKLYSFNILDSKWDVVEKNFTKEKYQELFDKFLMYSEHNKEKINECIKKYNHITQSNYLETFFKYNYFRDNIFSFLVNNDVIELKYFLDDNKEEELYKGRSHLSEYIECIRYKKAFDFMKYLIEQEHYSIKDIDLMGFNFNRLYRHYSYDSYIDIMREFLTVDEEKFLFKCLEQYMFSVESENYITFLNALLDSEIAENLIPKEELRMLYRLICEIDSTKYKNKFLQEKYLEKEEISAIHEQERLEKEAREKQRRIEKEQEVVEEFEKIEKNNFKNLYKFCDKYYYNSEQSTFSFNIIKEHILNNINEFRKELEDMKYLCKVLEYGISKESVKMEEVRKIMCEYLKGG